MDAGQLDLLRADELDIALRLSFLEHCGGAAGGAGLSAVDDKEARRKEKKKQKDLKVRTAVRPRRRCVRVMGAIPSSWQSSCNRMHASLLLLLASTPTVERFVSELALLLCGSRKMCGPTRLLW